MLEVLTWLQQQPHYHTLRYQHNALLEAKIGKLFGFRLEMNTLAKVEYFCLSVSGITRFQYVLPEGFIAANADLICRRITQFTSLGLEFEKDLARCFTSTQYRWTERLLQNPYGQTTHHPV